MRLVILAILSTTMNCPTTVFAAEETSPTPGSRVRITYPCRLFAPSDSGACTMVGSLARWEADSLAVATADRTTPFALRDVNRLESSQGQKSYRFLGAGLGAVMGAGATYLILNSGGSTSLCDQSANQDAMNSSECLGLYALGGLAGAGIGFVIGGLIHSEHWQDVPVPH